MGFESDRTHVPEPMVNPLLKPYVRKDDPDGAVVWPEGTDRPEYRFMNGE